MHILSYNDKKLYNFLKSVYNWPLLPVQCLLSVSNLIEGIIIDNR